MCEKIALWTIRLIRTALSVLLPGPVLFIGMQWQQIEAEQTSATEKASGNQQPEFKILPDWVHEVITKWNAPHPWKEGHQEFRHFLLFNNEA
jgi:hypothetical protein